VLEELFSIREYLPTDSVAAFFTPKTPVFLIAAELERVLCRGGDRCAAEMKRSLRLHVCHLDAV
jgi:hypothetical protein